MSPDPDPGIVDKIVIIVVSLIIAGALVAAGINGLQNSANSYWNATSGAGWATVSTVYNLIPVIVVIALFIVLLGVVRARR